MNTLETHIKEIVDAVIFLHEKRAVSALNFSTSQAVESLKSSKENSFLPDFNPRSAAELLSKHQGMYEHYAKLISSYIDTNFPCTSISRCWPGDLIPRRNSIYEFIKNKNQESQTPLPSSQYPSQVQNKIG